MGIYGNIIRKRNNDKTLDIHINNQVAASGSAGTLLSPDSAPARCDADDAAGAAGAAGAWTVTATPKPPRSASLGVRGVAGVRCGSSVSSSEAACTAGSLRHAHAHAHASHHAHAHGSH